MPESKKYTLIDLFCGCGGMTLGFQWTKLFNGKASVSLFKPPDDLPPVDFTSVWANDFNQYAIETYRANFDNKSCHSDIGPIEKFLADNFEFPHADVVIGGPPCQGFSPLNKNREGDDRRKHWWHFMEVAEKASCKTIVMENVPELLGSPEFDKMKKRLKELGFNYLMANVLWAPDFGVPQLRKRSIIMASRTSPISLPLPRFFPAENHLKKSKRRSTLPYEYEEWRTTFDAIADLPLPVGQEIRMSAKPLERLHFGRTPTATSLERYRAVPLGGNRFDLQKNRPDITPKCWIKKTSGGTDLFGRLWWDRPSVTIRTEFFKPEKGRYLHPDQHRPITHREAARLQSFPDSFVFKGSKTEIAKQIGNAVPPLLAFAIALEVRKCIDNETTVGDMYAAKDFYEKFLGEKIKAFSVPDL